MSKETRRLANDAANKSALSKAQSDSGHHTAARGSSNAAKGLRAEIAHLSGKTLGKPRS